mmetsp:Transcript_124459/g.248247  ORF Transcript_124459/g.248247 Transcript_124459/m.248247 type:complete len:445 (-) Transcript_124459:111-1445(-)
MKIVRVNVALLVMGIFGNLGVALKARTQGDLDSDGDDSNDENTGSPEEANAPANDSSSGGGSSNTDSAGGALDVAGLQKSLKEEGVDGLNNMLKSFAATMNSASSANGANMHITKDADGHDMYDFRDVEASSTPTPAHAESAQTVPLRPPLQAPPVQSKAISHVEKTQAEAQSSDMAAISSSDDTSADSLSKDVAAAKLGKIVALPLHAIPKGVPLPSIWESHERKVHAKFPSVDSSQKQGNIAQAVLERPVPPQKFETTAVTERTAVSPVAQPEVSRPAQRPLPPSSMAAPSTATGGSIVQLSSSLDEVRRNVDRLLTLALRKQDEAPSADQKQPVMDLPLQNREMSERVGALERENSKLARMLQVQAGRLEAIESQQQDEDRELGQVLHENIRLRAQLHKTDGHKKSSVFMHVASKKMAKKPAQHFIRTYYHRRNNGAGQKH